MSILGTVTVPSWVVPTPTAPDLLEYVCWPSAFGTAFNYTVTPGRDIATTSSPTCSGFSGGDSAVLYFFGSTSANAHTIATGATLTVSASRFVTPPRINLTAPAMDTAGLAFLFVLLAAAGSWLVSRQLR